MTRCLLRLAVATAILCIFVFAGGLEERWAYYSGSVAGDAKAAPKAIHSSNRPGHVE